MNPDKKTARKRSRRLKDIKGIALAAAGILLLLGLLDVNIGVAQAFTESLYMAIGYISYLLPLFLLWWALNQFAHKDLPFKYAFFWGFISLLVGGTVFLHLVAPGPETTAGGGGAMGHFVTDGMLTHILGTTGTYIISIALLAASTVLLADVSVRRVALAVFGSLKAFLLILYSSIKSFFTSAAARVNNSKKGSETAVKPPKAVPKTSLPDKKKEKPQKKEIKKKEQAEDEKKPSVSAGTPPKKSDYRVPVSLLKDPKPSSSSSEEEMERGGRLIDVLKTFEIEAEIAAVEIGPSITRYEIEIPPGIKLSKIRNLASNIAMALKAKTVRMLTPIPGKSAVGVEVPAIEQEIVYMKSMVQSSQYTATSAAIPYCIGKSVSGENVVADLASMPHLLLAGATGSGKSVAIHTIINSILFKLSPEDVRLFLIDPKRVELPVYRGIPHLAEDVVCESRQGAEILANLTVEMDSRYDRLAENNVSDIDSYNRLDSVVSKMPRLVVIIDELADLMALARDKVERSIVRLAQMSRAVGIHLVLATQRPSVDVITGLIKANLPARIAFNVLSGVDSRTILDMNGAEKLLGKGDLLYLPPSLPQPLRIQGTFISRGEIEEVVKYLKQNLEPEAYSKYDIKKTVEEKQQETHYEDELYPEAVRVILKSRKASISLLQRKLRIGYNRAARIIDTMDKNGIVGPEEGTKPRKILVGKEYLEEISEH